MAPRKKPNAFLSNVEKVQSFLNPERLFTRSRKPPKARTVYINQPIPEVHKDPKGKVNKDYVYSTNQVVTSKYTIFTFVPRNLLEQFRRIANIFFLGIAILQFFPKFSTISPGLVILPLLAILFITACKDGYEDIKRHQSDGKVNHSVCHVLSGPDYLNHNLMTSKSKTFIPGAGAIKSIKNKRALKKSLKTGVPIKKRVNWGEVVTDDHEPEEVVRLPGEDLTGARTRDEEGEQPEAAEEDPEAVEDTLGWKKTRWEDVKVGDFIKIYNNEGFPADIVICSTSEDEDVAFIETKNLDGETNLKSRHAVPELAHLRSALSCSTARFKIDSEAPEVNMFRLNAAVVVGDDEETAVRHPVDLNTCLLRGCVLRNTAWVIGVVVFTGLDTKIVANSGGTPSKRSKVERQMNPQVLLNLSLLGVVGMVCAIVDHFNEVVWYRQNSYWTLFDSSSGDNPQVNGIVTFANSLITFQNIVPISLYISIEFVRTCQAAFIYFDDELWYRPSDTRCLARSWNLSDDMGQIKYIFSDKTGTLTQNAMVFQQASIAGKVYAGTPAPPAPKESKDSTKASAPSDSETTNSGEGEVRVAGSSTAGAEAEDEANKDGEDKKKTTKEVIPPFYDSELAADLTEPDSEAYKAAFGFFSTLALCHTVLAVEKSDGSVEYRAQSPDEQALVQAAADCGFIFRGRDRNILRLQVPNHDELDEYELLNVLEFSSARKRMSVLIRKLDDDRQIFLLVKGADNVIMERLVPGNDDIVKKTNDDLSGFANQGLRTLCLGYRIVPDQEYAEWAELYHQAEVALEDREKKIEDASSKIEHSLELLGSTAIEDKLQDGVPETIADLKRAGIKVWVATGDKLETAIAIGYSTNLLSRDSNLIVIRGGAYGTVNSAYDQMRSAIEQFFGQGIVDDVNFSPPDLEKSTSGHRPSFQQRRSMQLRRTNTGMSDVAGPGNGTRPGGYSLVIEGGALTHAFEEEWTEDLLLQLSTRCNTVICCRVSPLQKAQIVHLIKDNLGVMTLAIGEFSDGANDVSMIQAADVGIGISGEEGLQAVNSSDYAIAQFKYLKRLLLVHGHWSYIRNSNMILNFFYKNLLGVGVLFFFQIYCGWSTTYVFSYVYLLLWNVLWSIAPVIAMGIFDRDLDADILMALPELYRYGREGEYFGLLKFGQYVFEGVYHCAVVFFFINYAYDTTSSRRDGLDIYMYEFSTVMVIGTVMVVNMTNGINTHSWNWWVVGGLLIGPFLILAFSAVYAALPPNLLLSNVYGNNDFVFHAAYFWFGVIYVCMISLLPKYIYLACRFLYFPDDIESLKMISKYDKSIDVEHHPLLGGHFSSDGEVAKPTQEDPFASDADSAPRLSSQSNRMRPLVRTATGTVIDMSSGSRSVAGAASFGFSQEEGGVAMSRLNSRLSSVHRMQSRTEQLRDEEGGGKSKIGFGGRNRPRSGTLGSLRARAGSVFFSNKKTRPTSTETIGRPLTPQLDS